MTKEMIMERTPAIIAAEINSIKQQTGTIILANSIEIGRRLVEAKDMVEHGKWLPWLKEHVDYSDRTAQNLMKIFEEYGSSQGALFGNHEAKTKAFSDLTYSHAIALLGVPTEERETFVEDHDIKNKSTRELKEIIRERDEALKAKEESDKNKNLLEKEIEALEAESEKLRKTLEEARAESTPSADTEKKLKDAEKKITGLKDDLRKKNSEIKELSKAVEPQVIEKIPEATQKQLQDLQSELKAAQEKANNPQEQAVLKYKIYFEELKTLFNNMIATIDEISDEETREKYKFATERLICMMKEKVS